MRVRRVMLRVVNIPWLADYHGREAGLVGTSCPAVELDDAGVIAYVDDRDGEASEYAEALEHAQSAGPSPMGARILRELREHAARRLLHGEVEGVRT